MKSISKTKTQSQSITMTI